MANQKDEKRVLEDLLAAMTPHANRGAAEPSAARLYVRNHFATLSAARTRGITWPQIAYALAKAGVTATDGTQLEWRTVSSLFHSERYARGESRKRRTKKPVAPPLAPAPTHRQTSTTTQQPRDAVAFDPDDGAPGDKPPPKFSISRPK
jgi:hypothetical protein